MLFWKLNRKYFNAAGDDGAGGGAGGEDVAAAAAAKAAADKALADKAAADAVAAAAAKAEADKKGMTDKEHELLKEVMDKKAKLQASQTAIAELEAKIKAFDGIDPTEIRTLLAAKKEEEEKRLEAAGEFDKVKAQMREAHQKEVKTLAEQIQDLSNQIKTRDGSIDELSIGHSFANSRFISDKLVLPPAKARTVYGTHFERDAQGRVVAYDKPRGESGRAPLVNADGDPLPFDEALAKLVDRDPDKDLILRAGTKPGAGSGTSGGSGKPTTPELTGIARIKGAISAGALKPAGLRLAK